MFKTVWTPEARKNFQALEEAAVAVKANRAKKNQQKSSKQEGLFKQVDDAIKKLETNPRHPGLHTHEYDSIPNPYDERQKVFEAYAQKRTPGA